MLQLKKIHKEYKTGNLEQIALNEVSLNLRDNEFVAILGPSGSGKTTLLNIIGGLDRYDSGDLVINGISTKKYTDRDWDSYRNHTIGFVFQSYNLIPHQTVLANVELALTISGVPAAERRRRAAEALIQVGLGSQMHKRPGEMSGGQMQRVAIARALVNNPDILLADEPTGALDSETSVQVMELLKEVAQDRLVVMVTHNPELAERYATRIVRLRDGVIRSDTMPYHPEEESLAPPVHKNMGRSSMSLFTALHLSFNNLRTKKARTLLTSFAGSIGIIGIALILALSNGVNGYIADVEQNTLAEYPLQILSGGIDISTLFSASPITPSEKNEAGEVPDDPDLVTVRQLVARLVSGLTSNDLTSLKSWLESDACTIAEDATSIEYSYSVTPQIYRQNEDETLRQVNPDSTLSALGLGSSSVTNEMMSSMMNISVFSALPENPQLYESQYQVRAGRWPEKYNECVVVLASDGCITDYALYAMGLRDDAELDKMLQQFAQNQEVDVPTDYQNYRLSDFLGMKFKLIHAADKYAYDAEYNVWKDKSDDDAFMWELAQRSEDLTIVGVVQPLPDASAAVLASGISYSADLVPHVIEYAQNCEIVRQQLTDPLTNVFTGEEFGIKNNASFDLDSMFTVDTDALKNAFQFDEDALSFDLEGVFQFNGDSLDLSTLIDLDSISLDGAAFPEIDFEALLSSLDLSIPADAMQTIVQRVFDGYKQYVIKNIFRWNKLSFSEYLKTDEFQQLLSQSMNELIGTDSMKDQLQQAMQQTMQTVMDSYAGVITDTLQTQLSAAMQQAMTQMADSLQESLRASLFQLGSQMENAIHIDTHAFQNAVQFNLTETDLTELLKTAMSSTSSTYSSNLQTLGYANLDSPSQIRIYPRNFESKSSIVAKLDAYNAAMQAQGADDKVIQYTDMVGTLMTSVTSIVNMISYVLVAFVAISLVVSSIMIGVITYISVLERRKEIGILRAIGASKGNVSTVFNAETFIIGLCSGGMGILLSEILLIPGNAFIRAVANSDQVTAVLPLDAAVVLILLATVLTMLGGLIPARSAAKCNPVTALRSE
ncbi:MAG: ATP-binding cassette domain-containing protein [Faecalibacterium sp.]